MAQYPIPQFIEAEGKIISFLTFRQFFLLVGGGAFCLVFYYTLPFSLFFILSILVGLLVLAIAFLKVDNTSVVTMLFNLIRFLTRPKDYTWQKKESSYPFKVKVNQEAKNIREFGALESQAKGLQDIKKIVEYRKK